ncbi:hypothetical protein C4J97_1501 [Pseudomonas orientalis]|nr:hypothetical protein C4J97_1501 [Pseudomonas orientalis]
MLAKNVNDNAGSLIQRGALRFFASKLAPTGEGVLIQVSRSAWAFCIMRQVFIMAGCYVWFSRDGKLLARRLFPGVAA